MNILLFVFILFSSFGQIQYTLFTDMIHTNYKIYSVYNRFMQEQHQQKSPLPKKKVKKDLSSNNNQNIINQQNPIFCKCYSQQQANSIIHALANFKSYTKYISIMIRHQQKSLQTLPKHILEMKQFQQLNHRIKKCIQRARINNQFLAKIAQNYSEYLHNNQFLKSVNYQENDLSPNMIIHLFINIAKQWSELSPVTRRPIHQILGLIKKHSIYYNGTQKVNQGPQIFVQHSGMGRILCELQFNLQQPRPSYISGCEDRVLNFICAEYFLQKYKNINKMDKKQTIYPFIHDFSNKYKTADAYEGVQVPQWPYTNKYIQNNAQNEQNIIFSTFSKFQQDYVSSQFNDQWDILISYVSNDKVQNVLRLLQVSYKNLKQKGIWILALYSSFQRNVIPITYKQFRDIIEKSQFKVLEEKMVEEKIIQDRGMTKEKLNMHYLVLEK